MPSRWFAPRKAGGSPGSSLESAAAREDCAAIVNHLRVTAKIRGSCLRRQFPQMRVFADEVVDAAHLSGPVSIIPGPAHRGDVLEPRDFVRDALELFQISKLPRAAGAFQEKKPVALRSEEHTSEL